MSQYRAYSQTVKMTKISNNNIWNPWVDAIQEEALDLTVKKEETEVYEKPIKQFDFAKFYQTYSMIAQRNYMGSASYEQNFDAEQETFWGRNNNESFSDSEPAHKKSRRENKKEEISPMINSRRKYYKTVKNSKKTKTKMSGTLSKIQSTCDCRFCYEDHIMKMRLKVTQPYL